MPEPIETYLDELMRSTHLAGVEASRMRSEIREHIHQMLVESNPLPPDPEEVMHMLHDQFGEPRNLGRQIAAAKGRGRAFVRRQLRRLPAAAALAIILLGIRATVAEPLYVTTDSVAPALRAGSRCLVYKLASDFQPGDVIVYRPAEHPNFQYLAIVQKGLDSSGTLTVVRRSSVPFTLPQSRIVGRIVLNTR